MTSFSGKEGFEVACTGGDDIDSILRFAFADSEEVINGREGYHSGVKIW